MAEDKETVTRRLHAVDGYLAPGMEVAIDSTVYSGDPTQALGLPSATVAIPDELGSRPRSIAPACQRC